MLVLSRKIGEKIVIDDRVTITITRVAGGRVSVGIEAPTGMRIVRGELKPLAQAVERNLDRIDALIRTENPRLEGRGEWPLDLPTVVDMTAHAAPSAG